MKTVLEEHFEITSKNIYEKCNWKYFSLCSDIESSKYGAATFKLEDLSLITRSSKITPKKVGQFVTLWKRNEKGETTPYESTDPIDFFIINVSDGNLFGQFIFPNQALEKHGIISGKKSKGKRGFRVYSPWDIPINSQARNTQKWQLDYFLEVNQSTNIELAKNLYKL